MTRRKMKTSKEVSLKYGFRSGLEESVGEQLKAVGIRYNYESLQLPFVQPEKKRRYTPDFVLKGTEKHYMSDIVIETKGRFTLEDRQKHLLIKEQYPDLDLRFVFSNPNNKIRKGSKTTYADWCNKHGFKYSKKEIPSEWLKELE
jgi:hypothetical protein